MRNLLYIVVFLQTFMVSVLAIPGLVKLAFKFDVVDKPGARKVHQTAHPLLGGVAIAGSFLFIISLNLFLFVLFGNSGVIQNNLPALSRLLPLLGSILPKFLLLLGGGLAIHLLGLLDDIFKERIPYQVKFIAQFVIAVVVAIGGIRTDFMPHESLDVIITVVWIVGMTNSFNLLDNLDGLTAGVAFVSAAVFFTIAFLQGQVFFAFVLCALAGSCLGFLLYNFHPSKLFMGDSGSLFIGYIFGALTVMGSYVIHSSASLLPVLIPILVLSVPLYDTFSVMFIRWREGRPLFVGDKRHFSHRLLDLGLTHRQAVVFIYLVCFGVGMTAILLPYISLAASFIVLLQALVVYLLITVLISIGRNTNNNF
jgi:UDP-GlcNAc:undecaprenyl-phosphate/decaprenyl-phosphate GlcNAc-1-phosphate transferase